MDIALPIFLGVSPSFAVSFVADETIEVVGANIDADIRLGLPGNAERVVPGKAESGARLGAEWNSGRLLRVAAAQ
ncbi:hypothetical protein ACFQ2Y_48010 [Streptomyces malaysiensis subsp. malaysiensis]